MSSRIRSMADQYFPVEAEIPVQEKLEKSFTVTVDKDITLGYETKRFLYRLSLPLMWVLTIWVMIKKTTLGVVNRKPGINTFLFDKLSVPCRGIKEGAASWQALDIIYNYEPRKELGIRARVSDFWIGMINAQAVRNRLRLVKRELAKAIREIAKTESEVRVFSIASGSAQAVLETMIKVMEEGIKVKALFLDSDPEAIKYSHAMAKKYGLEDQISFVVSRTSKLVVIAQEFKPHIVEMVGFLDYRPLEQAIKLVKRIYSILPDGGKFLTANMHANSERFFMKWVIDWSMIYRRPQHLARILYDGGFNGIFGSEKIRIIFEPLKLHMVAICSKP